MNFIFCNVNPITLYSLTRLFSNSTLNFNGPLRVKGKKEELEIHFLLFKASTRKTTKNWFSLKNHLKNKTNTMTWHLFRSIYLF